MEPFHRYQRLCNASDVELLLTLQALGLDPSALALSVSSQPSNASDALTLLSPQPSEKQPAPTSTAEHKIETVPIHPIPQSVIASLTSAALATREPKWTPPPIPHTNPPKPTPSEVHVNSRPRNLPSTPSRETPSIPKNNKLQQQPPGFHTARSRLLRSKLYTNRNSHEEETAPHHQSNSRATGIANSSRILTAPTGGARPLLGSKRSRFSPPRPKQQAEAEAQQNEEDLPEVPNVDPRLVQMIMNEVLEQSPGVDWDDIAGLQFAKRCVMEAVVWPMLRPDIFTGLRGPPKGLLLFGPPGTGKTMIGRAIASKSGARFFNISASSLVSKWAGEGEKTVRALFGVARIFQPSVIFIDEIDSLLTQRSDGEQEHSRRIKTEFLVQMDGAGTSREDRVLVVGATNRPQELDEAARRRLVKRLYIPLPDMEARCSLVSKLLQRQSHSLSTEDTAEVGKVSTGYSGSDMYALCAEAALGPVRELGDKIASVDVSNVRPVSISDFKAASRMVRASVSNTDLDGYVEWNKSFGSFSMKESINNNDSSNVNSQGDADGDGAGTGRDTKTSTSNTEEE